MTIYEKTPHGLYAQPGRKVTKFPSGRIRVDQTYVCSDTTAAMIPVPSQITLTGSCLLDNSEVIPLPKTLNFNGYYNGRASYILVSESLTYEVWFDSFLWNAEISFYGPTEDKIYSSHTSSDSQIPYFTSDYLSSGSGSCTSSAAAGATMISPTGPLAIGNPLPDGDNSPAIDGLSIFPASDENRRGDGFTEFNVSAYGRVSTALSGIQLTPVTVLSSTFYAGPVSPEFLVGIRYKLYNIAGSITIPSVTVLEYDDLGLDSSMIDPFDFEPANANVSEIILDALVIDEGTKGEITDTGYMVTRSFKLWQVRLTADGINPSHTYHVKIYPPSVSVKSYKNFGAFTEVEIETSIENTTTQITA